MMPKMSDCRTALFALIAFAAWLFVGLPFLYASSQSNVHGEILGVKYGEWLLFGATMGLWWATWLLVKGAEKTAERQLRAYLFPDAIIITDIESYPEVTVTIKNSGQTPAQEHSIWATMGVASFPNCDSPTRPNGPPNSSMGPLAPGATTHFFIVPQPRITAHDLQEIREGRAAIYLTGGIEYRDAFGKSRYTNFCYVRAADDSSRQFADGPMSVYQKWNAAN
jgi:hypothetical protein